MMACVVAAALAMPQAAPSPAPPTFRAQVAAVHVDVSVRRGGKPVQGLAAADFEVLDDGVRQEVELVEGGDTAIHAVLALDVSESVAGPRLEALRAAAQAFLEGLSPRDRATVVVFSHRVRLMTPVGAAPADAVAALARTEAGGGTALHDGAYAALALADRRHGRPVVLVFSDGQDTSSWLTEPRLRALAAEADAVVHSVASTALPENARQSVRVELDPRGRAAREAGVNVASGTSDAERVFDAWSQATTRTARGAEVPAILRVLADETGGEVWRVEEGASLRDAFLAALADVRSRYVLRFEPAGGTRGQWRRLEVRVKGRGDVRARKGYRVR